jgi:hypothetical protein
MWLHWYARDDRMKEKRWSFKWRRRLKVSLSTKFRGGRCGGVIYDSDGQKVVDFSWGLGKNTNNREETLECTWV